MIKKAEKVVITFYTTTDAMAMEQMCKRENADGRLIPVPRTITAGCGLAWCGRPEKESELKEIMQKNEIAWQGIYRCMV